MLLQEHHQRKTIAAFGEAARAAMARRATVREQPRRRFALIEILGLCPGRIEENAAQRNYGTENEPTAPQRWLRPEFR
jgi:hypothetical protein